MVEFEVNDITAIQGRVRGLAACLRQEQSLSRFNWVDLSLSFVLHGGAWPKMSEFKDILFKEMPSLSSSVFCPARFSAIVPRIAQGTLQVLMEAQNEVGQETPIVSLDWWRLHRQFLLPGKNKRGQGEEALTEGTQVLVARRITAEALHQHRQAQKAGTATP